MVKSSLLSNVLDVGVSSSVQQQLDSLKVAILSSTVESSLLVSIGQVDIGNTGTSVQQYSDQSEDNIDIFDQAERSIYLAKMVILKNRFVVSELSHF